MSRDPKLIPIGESAPKFTALLSNGGTLDLAELIGSKRVLLIFYPGDETPICRAQLCSMRDRWSDFQKVDTLIYGINPASSQSHARFVNHHNLPFSLVIDQDKQIARSYGCVGIFGMIRRTVYLIDSNGKVAFSRRGRPGADILLEKILSIQDSLKHPI